MPIHICCECGKEFNVPEDRATKPFKCHMCQRQLVAAPASEPSATDVVPGQPGGGPDFRLDPKPVAPPQEQPSPEGTASLDLRTAGALAADRIEAGVPREEIERELMTHGLDEESAEEVVEEAREARNEALKEAGQRNMLFGALWCVGGIVVTVGSFYFAANVGAGKYVIAWGAIVVGAVEFVWGVTQLGRRE